MPAPSRALPRQLPRLLAHLLVVLVLGLASVGLVAPSADAMSAKKQNRVVKVAASKKGTPYRYGATGPRAFDCSGFTRWVYRKVGKRLPRTSRAQARAVRHVRKSQRRRGDLVFFRSGGRVYHVAIYAGRGRVWHAPRPGRRVSKDRIWTRQVSYGRVR